MRKLALSDEILLKVDKAARYIGGEVNSIDLLVLFTDLWCHVIAFISFQTPSPSNHKKSSCKEPLLMLR